MKREDLAGLKVTVMGLGLNGGGIETTRFLAKNGASVTVTDLRDEAVLAPSLEKLSGVPFRAVLGRHEDTDFRYADMVIKNPAVRPNNPFIGMARRIETDLSLFFSLIENPVIAVTGSKGKSTTASAIHYGLLKKFPGARIGGNITISPLSFIDDLSPGDPIVMELSSFQLGDLERSSAFLENSSLPGYPPFISIITNILHDHQDYYKSMPPYISDKEAIFRYQTADQHAIFLADDRYGPNFAAKTLAKVWQISAKPLPSTANGGWLAEVPDSRDAFRGPMGWLQVVDAKQAVQKMAIFPEELALAGRHHRLNLLFAATALHIMGVSAPEISERLASFPGVEHRLETVARWKGITFINDSAATIPEAVLGAVTSLNAPIHLICGGADKALQFDLFPLIRQKVATMSLLKGTASEYIGAALTEAGLDFAGPYADFNQCIDTVVTNAKAGEIILLSPGCASFGMFLNEFDRGNKFRAVVKQITAS